MKDSTLLNQAHAPASAVQVGTEWLIDADGCWPDQLRDLATLRRLCARILAQLELHVIGEGLWHKFPAGGGVTGLYLLTESHLACHTYPESGTATFNLYCCRPRPRWPWEEQLRELLGAARVTVRSTPRGTAVVRDIPEATTQEESPP